MPVTLQSPVCDQVQTSIRQEKKNIRTRVINAQTKEKLNFSLLLGGGVYPHALIHLT